LALMAKPRPVFDRSPKRVAICPLIPTTSPFMVISGPPELPGLTSVSVTMHSVYVPCVWCSAETMPAVKVGDWSMTPRPNGLPTAIVSSPTASASESPSGRYGTVCPSLSSSRRAARSPCGSVPSSFAL